LSPLWLNQLDEIFSMRGLRRFAPMQTSENGVGATAQVLVKTRLRDRTAEKNQRRSRESGDAGSDFRVR